MTKFRPYEAETTITFNVWIGNLNKYNCGELFGEWIDFMALDIDEINEKIAEICYNPELEEIGDQDEYFIADYDCNFNNSFGEYENIDELKEFADTIAEFYEQYGDNALAILDAADYFGIDFSDINKHEFIIHYGCEDMTDLAYEYVNECGMLDGVPDSIARYFDYEALGRDMSFDGCYYEGGDEIIELLD